MSSLPTQSVTADVAARSLKPERGDQKAAQTCHVDPSPTASFSTTHLPDVSQDHIEPLPPLSQPTRLQPKGSFPSPPLPTATPTHPLPARCESLSQSQSLVSENDATSSPPRANSMPSTTLPSPQSAHPTIASTSISTSDRSSSGDTFSSLGSGSYPSSRSSKSSFAWDVPTRNQSISGKRNVQGLAPVEERNLAPSASQDSAAQTVRQEASASGDIDIAAYDNGDDSFEDEASPADQIIYEIMSHLKRIPDIVAAAQVNTGFYGVFCDRGVDLIKSIILDTSPPAWEYMQTAYPTPEHPSLYLRNYRRASSCLSAVKKALFLRSEATLKPDTMDGLMGANHEKEQKVDAALWRLWTFCEIFGGETGRDRDSQSHMAWLQHGSEARLPDRPASFGIGNGKGLAAPELLLMAELWNALSALLQESFRLPSEDHRNSLFAPTDTQYPEELYFLEWVSYVMTFGLGVISMLASGSFEEAQNLGFANWSRPRDFGSRQAFLKDAVAQAYRRRLQEEAEAKAAAAGLSLRATHRALATTKRRPIVRPAVSSENAGGQIGAVPRKSVGSGASTKGRQLIPPRTPQTQSPSNPQDSLTRPHQVDDPQYNHGRGLGLEARQPLNQLRPEDGHASMMSSFEPETRPSSAVINNLSPYVQQYSHSLSGGSSEHSYHTRTPSSPPLHPPERRQLPPKYHKYAVVDPVDKALALLVDKMGFSLAASKKALAASDDGSGLNTDKAIALLRDGMAASNAEKIPVIDAKQAAKPSPRFGGMKFRFGSKPTQPPGTGPSPATPQKPFGELRPTKKERTAYAELSKGEAKGIKADVFRPKVYREAFGDLFQGGREEKSRKDSSSIHSAVEAGGRPITPVGSWSLRSLDVESMSGKKKGTATAAADVRSVRS